MADRNSEIEKQKFVAQNPRITGIILLSIGLGAIYAALLRPIQQVQQGLEVSLSLKGATLGVLGLTLGLTYLLFGSKFVHLFHPAEGQSKIPVYIAGFVLAGIGLALHIGLKDYLESKGYMFH